MYARSSNGGITLRTVTGILVINPVRILLSNGEELPLHGGFIHSQYNVKICALVSTRNRKNYLIRYLELENPNFQKHQYWLLTAPIVLGLIVLSTIE